jgi:hypothetical protein
LKEEIHALVKDKCALEKELSELSKRTESEKSNLKQVKEEFCRRQKDLIEKNEQEERKLNELQHEVSQMKKKIHLLATDLKEEGNNGESGLRSLLQTLSGEDADQDDGGVEMHTFRVNSGSDAKTPGDDVERVKSLEQLLEAEQAQNRVIQERYDSLSQDVEFLTSENDILRQQNKSLQQEVEKLRAELRSLDNHRNQCEAPEKTHLETGDEDDPISVVDVQRVDSEDETDREESEKGDTSPNENALAKLEHSRIRSHAEKLLHWADRAIVRGNRKLDGLPTSPDSSIGTELRPSPRAMNVLQMTPSRISTANGLPPLFPSPKFRPEENDKRVISNLETVEVKPGCACESSMFSGNAEHVDFYLPKLGVICSCGKNQSVTMREGSDPCALENILRDWQVDFLKSVGISAALELVHATRQRSGELAKDMRRWRKKNNLLAVKTKSCSVALHIWSQTCRSVVKSVQEQKAKGMVEAKRPEFLDVTLLSDDLSLGVSTLGFGGASVIGHG